MVYEVRTYRTKPGMRERFLRTFATASVPEHRRLGMMILGPFPAIDDADSFVFFRGFPDTASRAVMIDSFYAGGVWKEQLEGELLPLLESHETILVDDPEGWIKW